MIKHLEEKNVQFNLISKEDAKILLEASNYFYKITAYRKNFEKNKYGKYINLDFKFLQDLAVIDMRLRYIVLQMSLDIEHTVKTRILSDITNDPNEDGYNIVRKFLKHDNSSIDKYMFPLKEDTHYNNGLYKNYHKNTPIWVLFEVMSFGAFVKFVEFYFLHKRKPPAYNELQQLLKFVKNIRNLAAHNSPILLDITRKNQIKANKIGRPITTFTKRVNGLSEHSRKVRLTNRKIHDLTALLYVHYTYIESNGIKKARYSDLKELLTRATRFSTEYRNQDALIAVYKYFVKVVDFIS